MSKTSAGNFFEDFSLGQTFLHPTPRTVGEGDIALYLALTGSRHLLGCSAPVAHALGYPKRPLDDLLAFHLAFGKTVSDISLNAVANLGYADVRFLEPVYVGDTLAAESVVIGLKENRTARIRRRLGALHGGQPGRQGSAHLDPLGDGEEARQKPSRAHGGDAGNPRIRRAAASGGARIPGRAATSRPASPAAPGCGTTTSRRAHRPPRRHDPGRAGPHLRHPPLPEPGPPAFRRPPDEGQRLRPAPGLRRPRHFPVPCPELRRPGKRPAHRRHQRRHPLSIPPSPATPSTPARSCWRNGTCPTAPTWAPCACACWASRTWPPPI